MTESKLYKDIRPFLKLILFQMYTYLTYICSITRLANFVVRFLNSTYVMIDITLQK